MKSVKYHNRLSKLIVSGLALFLMLTSNLYAQEGDAAKGSKLFKTNCAACHKLEGTLVGPGLLKIGDKREKKWLKDWIKDNNALIASGDKLAKEVAEFSPAAMTPFPNLSDQDLEDILKYLEEGDKEEVVLQTVSTDYLFDRPVIGVLPVLLITLGIFFLLLFVVGATTKAANEDEKSEFQKITSNPIIMIMMVIATALTVAWFLFSYLIQIDVNEGYQPIQPIAFSHKVHAGDNKIDCQYCHFAAKRSKTSGIPPVNVCMNCHKSISEYKGKLFGKHTREELNGEIQKIYDAVGWKDGKYIEGYKQKPIKWVRIHNLPDFAYYNHSQHVNVAGVQCQTCHGPVEEMHEVRQFSPLTMGWCINCHRETEVDTTNEYYDKIHKQMIEKLKAQGVTDMKKQMTIAKMGGLECGKCHY